MEAVALTVDEYYTIVRQLRSSGDMWSLGIADKISYQLDLEG
jgi:hypothetical protein